jgi:GNAT superfamily N-acetyltransferase
MVTTVRDATIGSVTYRAFTGWDDLPGMGAANQAHRGRIGVIERIDLAELRHYYEHLPHTDLTRDVRIAQLDGRIVGYARAAWVDHTAGGRTYEATLLVDPAVWGRGIAAELFVWAESRLRELAAASPLPDGAPPAWYQTWLTEGDPETVPVFEAAGYRPVRRGAEMVRDTLDDPLPDEALPEGFELRPVPPDQLHAFWETTVHVFADTFGEPQAGEADFIAWRDDPSRDQSLDVVAWHGDEVAAYVLGRLHARPDGSVQGELHEVGTVPGYRRRGLARAVVARSLRVLRDRGASSAYLGVDLQNPHQALTLYESCGFRVVNSSLTYRRPFEGPWPEEPAP